MLQVLDQRWKEHLASMDQLRQGIHLRAYAQKQPKQEFKREAFELFQLLLDNVQFDVARTLTRVQIQDPEELETQERQRRASAAKDMDFQHRNAAALHEPEPVAEGDAGAPKGETFVREEKKVGRNEPCPCGSGKKFKVCCGRLE